MKPVIVLFFSVVFIYSCSEYTPKPVGFNRIDQPRFDYKEFNGHNISFMYSTLAYIDTVGQENKSESDFWFNIVYPDYNARIYCSYFSIDEEKLKQALDDSYYLAYSHVLKASGINQTSYNNIYNRTFGIIYQIEGSVATPFQFFLTDSVSNFFRASFYYDTQTKQDSVAPVTEFVRKDIEKMIESFKWQRKSWC